MAEEKAFTNKDGNLLTKNVHVNDAMNHLCGSPLNKASTPVSLQCLLAFMLICLFFQTSYKDIPASSFHHANYGAPG